MYCYEWDFFTTVFNTSIRNEDVAIFLLVSTVMAMAGMAMAGMAMAGMAMAGMIFQEGAEKAEK